MGRLLVSLVLVISSFFGIDCILSVILIVQINSGKMLLLLLLLLVSELLTCLVKIVEML